MTNQYLEAERAYTDGWRGSTPEPMIASLRKAWNMGKRDRWARYVLLVDKHAKKGATV